jgi:cystathionine beta-lyase/cystathionine gamma-synthase
VIPKCAGLDPADYDPDQIEHRYIRVYVGLEEPAHLIADLDQALRAL